MDEADITDSRLEFEQRMAMLQKKPQGPEPTGYCLNCETPLENGRRWCDKECMEDWCARERK